MSRAFAVLALIFALGCHAHPGVPADELSRVWRLEAPHSFGTGFPVAYNDSKATFLVAGHIVESDASYRAQHQDGRTLENGRLQSRHPELDAALLVFDSPSPVAVLQISKNDLRPGERVYSAGAQGPQAPNTARIWITTGLASDRDRVSVRTYSGGSGSPVMRADGLVCGLSVAVGVSRGRLITHQNVLVPMSDLREWLAQ